MEGKKQSGGMGVARVSLRGGPKLVRGTGYSRDAVRTPHLRFRSVRSAQSGTIGAPAALVPTRSRSESTRLLAVFQHSALPRTEVSFVDLERSVEIIEITFLAIYGSGGLMIGAIFKAG